VARLHGRAERRSDERQLKMPTGRVKFFNIDRGFGFLMMAAPMFLCISTTSKPLA
jgi:hypothetical protein